jgi:hypothetical protein
MAKAVLKNAETFRDVCLYQVNSPFPSWHIDAGNYIKGNLES